MLRKALIVGIDDYPTAKLSGCVNDAEEVKVLLSTNEDGSHNFHAELKKNITKIELRKEIIRLFSGVSDTALFYFSGHGVTDAFGYHIVTIDAMPHDMGIPMSELLGIVNWSSARNKIVILDCCYSGGIDEMVQMSKGISVYLCNGVTILTSSRANEVSLEVNRHGVFTSLLIEALKGGAADLNGNITPGSIYAFIDKVLGPGEQRPLFKTNISEFISLRKVNPQVPPDVMQALISFFPDRESEYPLDPSYEETNDPRVVHRIQQPYANPQHTKKFKQLQKLQSAGLVTPVDAPYMFFAAMHNKACKLTTLGKHYWKIIHG